MKIKVFITIVAHLSSILFFGLLFCVIVVACTAKDGELLVFEALIIFPFIVAFLFWLGFINLYLKNCKYPVPLLSTMQKLGLLVEMDINWSEEAQKDLSNPTYSTERFLTENRLTGNIENTISPERNLSFNNKHLQISSSIISWRTILDWHFTPGSEYVSDKIIVNYYNDIGIQEITVELDYFKTNKIDILLLLAHYKGKYGQTL